MGLPPVVGALLACALGAAIGSFVNVVAYRLPRGISIVSPRSFCPQCNQPLPLWANIPIFSWLALRGRCSACACTIALRDLLTEAALAAAAVYLYLNFPLPDALARFVLCAALLAVALIDFDWRVIPNVITFPGIPLGLIAATLLMPEVGLRSSLIGIALGAGFLFLTGEGYRLIRGIEGIGLGDVWLVGMTGAFLGWPGALFTLFVGSLFGSIGGLAFALNGGPPAPPETELPAVVARVNSGATVLNEPPASLLQTAIPFGPFLALAAATFALFQPELLHWYLAR